MTGQEISIASAEGGRFDCYLALPAQGRGPGIVIMSSIFGVDDDVRRDAGVLAERGFVVAAPDLFWRGDAGPLPRTEEGMSRAKARAQQRQLMIDRGVQDLADVIAELHGCPQFNGATAIVGLCYGGPYAILGPARLGCAAGIAFHGSKVEDYLSELGKVRVPLSLHWGDQDHAAPPQTLARIRAAIKAMSQAQVVVYPGVAHGYTAPSSAAWDEEAAARSWRCALDIVDRLRDPD